MLTRYCGCAPKVQPPLSRRACWAPMTELGANVSAKEQYWSISKPLQVHAVFCVTSRLPLAVRSSSARRSPASPTRTKKRSACSIWCRSLSTTSCRRLAGSTHAVRTGVQTYSRTTCSSPARIPIVACNRTSTDGRHVIHRCSEIAARPLMPSSTASGRLIPAPQRIVRAPLAKEVSGDSDRLLRPHEVLEGDPAESVAVISFPKMGQPPSGTRAPST
jgi:hypothetical protein